LRDLSLRRHHAILGVDCRGRGWAAWVVRRSPSNSRIKPARGEDNQVESRPEPKPARPLTWSLAMIETLQVAVIAVIAVIPVSQVVPAQNPKPAVFKGPPPRFLTVLSVDPAKGEVLFDVEVVALPAHDQPNVLRYPGGEQRLTLGTKPGSVHYAD